MAKKSAHYPVSQHGPVTVISLTGEVDMQTSPRARQQILNLLKQKSHLVVDLSATEYIDSSGIASLVEGLQLARSSKLQFGLAQVSNPVKQVLQLARLEQVFAIHDTVADCVEAFGGQAG